jgi:NAD(P)-dependent dehydrogenase (short-subunit alcohol dehydrogenase family)
MTDRRVALVTGCSRGIGQATAWRLAAAGWQVFATARRAEDLEGVASARVTPLALDLTDETTMRTAVDAALDHAGRIDALVNNAGYSDVAPIELSDPDAVLRQFQTNAFGPLRLSQLVLPVMRAQGSGRIVHLGTVMGRVSLPLLGAYSSSKAALEAFNDSLRVENRRFGVRVIMVIPGTVRSEFDQTALDHLRRNLPDETSPHRDPLERLEHMIEGGVDKGLEPEAVADRIVHALTVRHPRSVYLMAPDARFMTWGVRWLPPFVRDRALRAPFRL